MIRLCLFFDSVVTVLCGVCLQIGAYRTLNSETTVALDHFSSNNLSPRATEDDLLQINFNFSFPRLSCEYASVDAMNFMGTHDAGGIS